MDNKNIATHFLYPAAIFASKKQHLVTTVLGSCVGVCLFDTKLKVGGINHYMLPLWNGKGLASPKFGNIAIEKLYDKMLSFGCNEKDIIAKVFGGGEVLETNIKHFKIGERNIEIARQVLKELDVRIVASSVGGKLGRKIIYDTGTGNVMHKFIQKTT